MFENNPLISFRRTPYFFISGNASLIANGSLSIPINVQLELSKIFLVYPPIPRVASTYTPSSLRFKFFIVSFSKTGICLFIFFI